MKREGRVEIFLSLSFSLSRLSLSPFSVERLGSKSAVSLSPLSVVCFASVSPFSGERLGSESSQEAAILRRVPLRLGIPRGKRETTIQRNRGLALDHIPLCSPLYGGVKCEGRVEPFLLSLFLSLLSLEPVSV